MESLHVIMSHQGQSNDADRSQLTVITKNTVKEEEDNNTNLQKVSKEVGVSSKIFLKARRSKKKLRIAAVKCQKCYRQRGW